MGVLHRRPVRLLACQGLRQHSGQPGQPGAHGEVVHHGLHRHGDLPARPALARSGRGRGGRWGGPRRPRPAAQEAERPVSYPAGPGSQGVPQRYLGGGRWVPDPRYQGGGWTSYGQRGWHFTEPQLQRLWIAAGGDPALAPTMAAIAEQRESGGWSGAWNSTGATGLWQVEWP